MIIFETERKKLVTFEINLRIFELRRVFGLCYNTIAKLLK